MQAKLVFLVATVLFLQDVIVLKDMMKLSDNYVGIHSGQQLNNAVIRTKKARWVGISRSRGGCCLQWDPEARASL